jgi:hypothetical protein
MKILGVTFYLFGIFAGLTALAITFPLWMEHPVGLPCHVTSRDGTLHINDGYVTREYLVNGRDSFLLATGGRHPLGPVGMTILKGLPSGSTLHVEFCGSRPVRLISNGYKVYELTQERAEENRVGGIEQTGWFAIFMSLVAILGRWLVRRASVSDS